MSNSVKAAVSLVVVLLLAGCATGSRRNSARVPDWQSAEAEPDRAVLPPGAVLAPPPETSPASLPPPATAETWISLAQWCQSNGLPAPSRLAAAQLPTYVLSTSGGVFVLRPGSRLARWNGSEVWLGFAPQWIDERPFVHRLDLKKTLEPLVCVPGAGGLKAEPTIVIDPGHGGEDSGTSSVLGRGYEKDYTLDWARRLASLLATNGWRVLLTRSNDLGLAPSNRVAFAEERKADLFLSLHFNSSAPDHEQAGLETYCLTPAGMPSSVTRGYGDESDQAFANNAFDAQNLQLALRVHRALLQVNGHRDRGVRRARFPAVLRGEHRPAVLVEGGYLSNPREARLVAEPSYRQKLAEAVARALLEERPRGSAARPVSSELSQTNSPH